VVTAEAGVEMPVYGTPGKNDEAVFLTLPTALGIDTAISTFRRHDDEDEYLLNPPVKEYAF
jgi:hypothetical protein